MLSRDELTSFLTLNVALLITIITLTNKLNYLLNTLNNYPLLL